ncbi:hypothetical protein [Hymenobacter sp. BRD67]|uniref:hypothetical protein n=1 Tax=Hymenobacter sp. BRD67 TaxID=2675877 RepID=UPI0015661A0C|nr:hypothetical protein [Hymenobacter sp. BRD67]QKG54403.1 hypothetical protein GKZ67_19595 [Hymenobacter sp. BRD67]
MNRYLALFNVAGLLLMLGCRKDDIVNCPTKVLPTPPPTSNLSLAEFTRRNSVPVQTFSLLLDRAQILTTSGGASISFPGRSFKVYYKDSLALGNGQVRLREIYSVADMLLTNMPTTLPHQGDMLVSGGEFNIQVRSNGIRLRLLADSSVKVKAPMPTGQDTTRQYVWKQLATKAPSDTVGWQLASPQRVQSLPGLYRALVPLDSISWWNIDQIWHAYRVASSVPVTVVTPLNPLTETRVFLRPVGFNGLLRMAPADATGTRWTRNIPTGADMIVAVLQSAGGQLYYGTQRITIGPGLVITPTLTAVSEQEAVRLIRQL